MLSKSDLQSYLQCKRKLWLERHRPELADAGDSSSRRRILDGNAVGEKARKDLDGELIWPSGGADQARAAEEAKAQIAKSPHLSVVEMPISSGGVYARADALVSDKTGYILRETKASSFPLKKDKVTPGKPERHHLNDIAIQAWVMSGAGLSPTRCELNLLNSEWRYPGDQNYAGLFRQMDVSAEMPARTKQVPSWIKDANKVLAGAMPETETGSHCSNPTPCRYQEHCLGLDPVGPAHPIELLPGRPGKLLAEKLRQTKGYVSILDPRPAELTGNDAALYRRIQEAHRLGEAVWVPGSATIMEKYPYPRYFFDFEGIDFPIPRWKGVRPYEQIPFQWSCHIERSPGVFEHAEFLDLSGNDPSIACIQRMLEVIALDDAGPIFVYSATYEQGRLLGLAERHPAHRKAMTSYLARVVDLLPIVKAHYYHPDMEGHFSIKNVLPVIAPDLDYAKLAGVQEGTGAQVAYIDAATDETLPTERRAEIDQQLRAYCRQDTWAMVEVAYFLARVGRPQRPVTEDS